MQDTSDSERIHLFGLDINNTGSFSLLSSPIDVLVGVFSFMSCEVLVDH